VRTGRLTLGEVGVGSALLILAAVAGAALALATFGHYSLPATLLVAGIALSPIAAVVLRTRLTVPGAETACLAR
jgi:hypothetical protein